MDSMARLPQANNACMHLMLCGSILNIYIENILSIPSKSISTLHVSILFAVRPQLRATQVNQDEEASTRAVRPARKRRLNSLITSPEWHH
jgi:hypothetical protein